MMESAGHRERSSRSKALHVHSSDAVHCQNKGETERGSAAATVATLGQCTVMGWSAGAGREGVGDGACVHVCK
jgi:hypothetical protein